MNRRSVILGLFVLTVFLVSIAVNTSGYSLFGPAKTRIVITYGNEKIDFFSTKKTLAEALAERGISLSSQDRTSLVMGTLLSGKAVKGSIDKALPVTIFDGYQKISGRSTSSSPDQILADNNIKVWPEDKVTTEIILDPAETDAAGLAVRISRAPSYFVAVDDKNTEIRSWDPNVSRVLGASKVTVNPQDEISPSKESNLVPGDTITITRINEVDLPVTSEVAYETKNTTSNSVGFGQSQVIQGGSNGIIEKTYHVIYKNGVEVSRWLKSTNVTKAVQHKIVARGSVSGRANFGYYDGMVTSFYKGYTGHSLLVTNLQNGKQVTVKIIGSGPFNGPLMDMGTEPFKAIGGSISSGFLPSVSVVLLD